MGLLVYRRRCAKPGPTCHTSQQSVANGNAGYFVPPPSAAFSEMHEMECFQGHLDTKVSKTLSLFIIVKICLARVWMILLFFFFFKTVFKMKNIV